MCFVVCLSCLFCCVVIHMRLYVCIVEGWEVIFLVIHLYVILAFVRVLYWVISVTFGLMFVLPKCSVSVSCCEYGSAREETFLLVKLFFLLRLGEDNAFRCLVCAVSKLRCVV